MSYRPTVNRSDTLIRQAITYGVNAPSPHNTQAWKFKILSDTEVLVYIDENRLLPATDPPARQIHMGSGCFIEVLSIGATSMGYKTQVDLFPEGTYSFEEIGQKPVAKLTLLPDANIKQDVLFDAIHKRQTNRKAYSGPLVTDEEFAQIRKGIGKSEAEIAFINKPEEMKPLTDIFYRAMEIECKTRHLYEETRIWMRYSEKERAEKRDGLSVPQTGVDGFMKYVTEFFLDNGNPKRWHASFGMDGYLNSFKKGLETAKGIVYFKTQTNEKPDWVKTGRTYARFHLAITKLNLYAHVYSQVLQEFPEMTDLYNKFHAHLGIQAPARVQMVVRIGRAKRAYTAPRREIEDYIIS